MKQRVDVPVSIGGIWGWLEGQSMLRLDVGLLVRGTTLEELTQALVPVLDAAPGDVGILVNVDACGMPVEKLLGWLEHLRTHARTRAMAILTLPYEGSLRYEQTNGLAFFWQETDALDWLRHKLDA